MAEGILKSILRDRGVNNIAVSSTGIAAMDGLPATPYAVEAARLWGVDVSAHRSRHLDESMTKNADLVLAMSPEHVEHIMGRDYSALRKTYLIKAFPLPFSPSQEGVQDPIGGTLEDYNETYLELDEILRRIANKIIELASRPEKNS
jgi:protein-tyrosine-phosphatase